MSSQFTEVFIRTLDCDTIADKDQYINVLSITLSKLYSSLNCTLTLKDDLNVSQLVGESNSFNSILTLCLPGLICNKKIDFDFEIVCLFTNI